MGNALGIARGAIDAFIELATYRSSTSSPALLRDRPLVQTRVAEAEAILNAARAYVVEAVGSAWEAVCAGVPDPSREIAQARLAVTHGCTKLCARWIWCSMLPARMRSTGNFRWSAIFGTFMPPYSTPPGSPAITNPPAKCC